MLGMPNYQSVAGSKPRPLLVGSYGSCVRFSRHVYQQIPKTKRDALNEAG